MNKTNHGGAQRLARPRSVDGAKTILPLDAERLPLRVSQFGPSTRGAPFLSHLLHTCNSSETRSHALFSSLRNTSFHASISPPRGPFGVWWTLPRKRAGLVFDKDMKDTGGAVRMKPEDPMKGNNLFSARAMLGGFLLSFVCSGHEERRSVGLLPKTYRRRMKHSQT